MKKESKKKEMLFTVLDLKTGILWGVDNTGFVYYKIPGGDNVWRKRFRFKSHVPVSEYKEKVMTAIGSGAKEGGKQPSIKTLYKWLEEGKAEATDGCTVEPDGKCPHGYDSWLVLSYLI